MTAKSKDLYTNIKDLLSFVISPPCFDKYFIEYDFLDKQCMAATISKGLGFGIILGSILVKLPQILKIVSGKSGEGINIKAVTFDLSAITIYAVYNFVNSFPFSAWGDAAFVGLQTAIIGFLILFYDKSVPIALGYILGYVAFLSVLLMTPLDILWKLQGLNIPILLIGKLFQAVTNYKNGSTGQLSAITCFLLFAGSLARIFTSIQETGDTMVIATSIAGFFSNTVIWLQMMYYWNSSTSKSQKVD